jgi:predicted ATPase/transcriptional regulator with XRE-family HTH domain
MPRNNTITPESFADFGELLEYLRRRAGLTQRELSIATDYSDSQISRLEHNQRIPDRATLAALFVPALDLADEPAWSNRLFELAAARRQLNAPAVDRHLTRNQLNNLPLPLTSFHGREAEIADLASLLNPASTNAAGPELRSRLVALVGPGGVGKTRLAIQTASELLEDFPDGVWMVDFAPLLDLTLVPQAVASIFGLREEGSQSMLAGLKSYLKPKTCLLLLDNCEHLLEACAQLAVALLQTCPNVSILATSRVAFGIAGETLFRLDPLPVPDLELPWTVERLLEHAGVRLFIERARSTLPGFTITADNSSAVGQVCRQLDGLPLAIELAAARVNVLDVTQIAERLEDSFRLLGRVNRSAPSRSQTLWACMDWSYDLLSDAEKTLFRRLAVFVGGWTLGAVETICTDELIRPSETFGLLAQLVDKSLVVVDHGPNVWRYRFLETIRQYALENLPAMDETLVLKHKHQIYYLQLIEDVKLEEYGLDLVDGLNRIEADYDNLRAALDRSLTIDFDSATRFRFLKQLGIFWEFRGFLDEGRQRISEFLARPEASALTLERAELLFQLAWLALYQSDLHSSIPMFEESRAIFQLHFPAGLRGEADVLNSLAAIEIDNGEASIALDYARKAFEISSQIGYPSGVNWAHHMMGVALGHLGEYDQAWDHLGAALHSHNRRRGMPSFASMLQSHGELAVWQGDYEKAGPYLEESLKLAKEAKDKWMIGANLGTLGWIALRRGNYAAVTQILGESLAVRREIGDKGGMAWCLEKLAETAALQGGPEKAARLLGKAASLRQSVDSQVNSADRLDYDRLLASLGEQLEPTAFKAAWEAGAMMELEQLIDLVFSQAN